MNKEFLVYCVILVLYFGTLLSAGFVSIMFTLSRVFKERTATGRATRRIGLEATPFEVGID